MLGVSVIPLIRRGDVRAYLLWKGQSLLFTVVTDEVLVVVHQEASGCVGCLPVQDLASVTKEAIEQIMQRCTSSWHAPEKPVSNPSKRAKSGALASCDNVKSTA